MSPAEGPEPPAGFRHLFSPITIGGFTCHNRIVNTVHKTALDESRELRYLAERARGGAALIGVQAGFGVMNYAVGPIAQSRNPGWDENLPSPATRAGVEYFDEVAVPALRRRAEAIHREGARCFAQVLHLGGTPHAQKMSPPVAPSAVPDPYDALTPRALAEDEIEEIALVYAQGIRRVRDAGFDAAELHGAHGTLVCHFLSPYYNRREDRWGGSLENRTRFVRVVLAAARSMVGDFPIGIRIGVDGDGDRRGITVPDLADIAAAVADDLAYISVSGGNYAGFGDGPESPYVSPWYREQGFNVPSAAAVKARVTVPVLVTGRIADPSVAEAVLADGHADLVGMVRALIADPQLPRKVLNGRSSEIRMCLGLSECHYIGPHRTPVNCAVNASAGREAAAELVAASRPKTVVVVGAGPAGMEAARVAARRGHRVYLCDRERTIGGTPRLLATDPNRRNLRDQAAYFEAVFAAHPVELMLGTTVTAEELIELGPDAVVIATGGRPVIPPECGPDDRHVVTALDVITERVGVGPRVVVVGGVDAHLAAPTVAERLADRGCAVELVTEQVDFAHGAEDGTRIMLLARLLRKGVVVSSTTKLVGTDHGGALLRNTFTGAERAVEDVSVVLACGLVADNALEAALRGHIGEVHVIGDALAPRRIVHATFEGARVGQLL